MTVPTIPTLSEGKEYKFNITARPEMDMHVDIEPDGPLNVIPETITLSRGAPRAEISVSGSRSGQYSLHYTLSGPTADIFDSPKDSRIFVGPKERKDDEINAYFRSVKSEMGYLNESCCLSTFTYPECPMTTDAVSFSSVCSWTSDNDIFTANGIVFARFKSLSVPLSVSGIEINYNMGRINTSVLKSSSCRSCEANKNNIVSQYQSKIPESFENCYFYKVQSGDVADFLTTYALANTFIHRISQLFPSWVGVQLSKPTLPFAQSFNDGDFSTSLVEQEGVSNIEHCDKLRPDYPGLYSVLAYAGGYHIQLRINEESEIHATREQTVCLAVNLCQEMNSPIYMQLPQSIQDSILKYTIFKPYKDADWSFSLDTVTFYPERKSVEFDNMYWNGTNMYSPYFPGVDVEIRSSVYLNFASSKENVRLKADPIGELGEVSLNVENSQVSSHFLWFIS